MVHKDRIIALLFTNDMTAIHMDNDVVISAFCDDALGAFDATSLSEQIKNGAISAVEVEKASLARARQVNPALNAITTLVLDPKKTIKSSAVDGIFAGIPSFIKDCDDVVGLKTGNGSLAYQSSPAQKNSAFVDQYLSLGMHIIGKTALPEFGLTSVTESSATGDTRNPWNTAFSPGGSSGGSAALVASGVVPIAHGNDGGGSIRTPASCCGLVGLKPSRGRVIGIAGALPLDITCQGVLTRSVRDTANFYCGAERYFANKLLPKIGHVTRAGKRRLKIAVFTHNAKYEESDTECAEAALKTASLCEGLGHHVEVINCPYPQAIFDDLALYFGSLAFAISKFARFGVSGKWESSKLEQYTKGLECVFKRNFFRYPLSLNRLKKYQSHYAAIFENYDVLLSPTNGTLPPKIGFMGPEQPFNVSVERLKQHVAFVVYQNISGAPGISLPLAMSKNNLPIGVHFAAAWGKEKTLLELAFELEEAQPRMCLSKKTAIMLAAGKSSGWLDNGDGSLLVNNSL